MSAVLHMETDSVRLLAGQMRSALEAMNAQNRDVSHYTQSANWLGPSRDEFLAEMEAVARQLDAQIEAGIVLAGRAEREADEWDQTAAAFSSGYAYSRDEMQRVLSNIMVGGAVLGTATMANMPITGGASTQAELKRQYEAMKWSDKFAEQHRIDGEIAKQEALLARSRSEAEIDVEMADVGKQLADLQAKRAEAEQKSKSFLNQLLPDWPLARDTEDGVPWRVKADDYEDEIAGYDAEIAQLNERRVALADEKTTLLANTAMLANLKSQQEALSSVINQGIPADGPTEPDWYKNGFGGCTNYVAEKRDLYVSDTIRIKGNAQDWKQSAINSGWDVGKQPTKGAVMVFQGEASADYKTANRAVGGHVAYVENVEKAVNGNYKVTISEASTIFKDGKFVPGVHTKVTTRTVEVPASGHNYVDFIYAR